MSKKSYLLNTEPVWRESRPGLRHQIPQSVQSWVYEAGSLTQRLRDSFGSGLKVTVLYHDRQKPFISETRLLQLPLQQKTLVREVLLSADGQPLIVARTIIPIKTLIGAQKNLSRLGTRPLGEVIFSYPDLQRLEMDCSCVKLACWTDSIKQQVGIVKPVWGRRTVYAIKGHELLVNEFFLPNVINELI